ncbi:hypothetical protein LTR05_000679 [Lithohypha guttulata]|uniref:Methyltransferase type 12 domain-containing protein n=1 Tax=Lithohypha guttulata TaxID=1690604 RepID=A0AAN7TBV9_9EURO|nr:hypothetical protein LTR05_000679 [Lithohypha guttulata]
MCLQHPRTPAGPALPVQRDLRSKSICVKIQECGRIRYLDFIKKMAPDRGQGDGATVALSAEVEELSITDDKPSDAQSTKTSHEPVLTTIPPHLSHDPATNAKRTDPFQFGQRYLNDQEDVFEYNAWDHVDPDEEHLKFTEEQYAKQRAAPVSDFDRERFNTQPEKWWDLFYKQKSTTFFKDRKWLVQEFPVLGDVTKADAGRKVVLEVGAGAELQVVAADFSKRAVETMREAPDYAEIAEGRDGRLGKMRAEVWDVAGESLPEGMEEESADVVVMIFIFSALNPRQWQQAVRNIFRLLKPGGEVLFRDYGRGDLAQVRFKTGRWMEENFYVRGDGTRVYFFEKDELRRIWAGDDTGDIMGGSDERSDVHQHGAKIQEPRKNAGDDGMTDMTFPRFDILNLDIDRRLIVNRQRRIKMYRCWIQGRFKKPLQS